MPSFSDSIFLFILALLLFGPKRLPVLARELGKWVGEFRRASNDFKMQMEDELRASEQEDRQKQIAAMESAAPLAPSLEEPSHPHLDPYIAPPPALALAAEGSDVPGEPALSPSGPSQPVSSQPIPSQPVSSEPPPDRHTQAAGGPEPRPAPLPIATAGDLRMMPPATGLPIPRTRNGNGASSFPAPSPDALHDFVHSIPESSESETAHTHAAEGAAHGD